MPSPRRTAATTWRPAHDRRAERHLAAPGALRTVGSRQKPTTLVVGGGIAGLAAATGLAERGVRVTLIERSPSWAAGSGPGRWTTARTMSRGFHAFFRQYYNLRSLLRRSDPALERLRPSPDYPLVSADGMADSFARIPRTPPFSFASFVALSPSFTAASLAKVDVAAALELLTVRFPDTFADLRRGERRGLPGPAPVPARGPAPRAGGVRPQLLRAPERVLGGRAGGHVPHLLPGLGRGPAVRRPDRRLRHRPCGRRWVATCTRLGVEVRTAESVEHADSGRTASSVRLGTGASCRADACVLAADPAATRQLRINV